MTDKPLPPTRKPVTARPQADRTPSGPLDAAEHDAWREEVQDIQPLAPPLPHAKGGVRAVRAGKAGRAARPEENFAAMLDEGRAPAKRPYKRDKPGDSTARPGAGLARDSATGKNAAGPPAAPAVSQTMSAPAGYDTGRELDRRTAERLRKGRLPIEARLDLHGMTQTQAQTALRHFIDQAARAEKRCLLVITGKGKRRDAGRDERGGPSSRDECRPGILRMRVPEWLAEDRRILRWHHAQPRDGGSGALYVLLRRSRTED